MKYVQTQPLIRAGEIGMSPREWKIFLHYLTSVPLGECVFLNGTELGRILSLGPETISALRTTMVGKGLLEIQYREHGINYFRISPDLYDEESVSENAEELVAA